jgi:protein-tyrosine phosphatase
VKLRFPGCIDFASDRDGTFIGESPIVLRIFQQIKDALWRTGTSADSNSTKYNAKHYRSIHWVIPGKLAIGGLPRSEQGKEMAQNGIKVLLSLCDETEGALPQSFGQQFRCLRFVLPDSHYARALKVEQLIEVVNLVHQTIQHQQPLYVHCLAGIERSPTVCIAYLCQYYNLELWEAMNWIKQAHPSSTPSTAQVRVLREFVNQCCKVA